MDGGRVNIPKGKVNIPMDPNGRENIMKIYVPNLDGGFLDGFYFYPDFWGNDPI